MGRCDPGLKVARELEVEPEHTAEMMGSGDVPVLGTAAYTLAYQYAPGDTGLSWTTKEARGAVRDIRGEYLLDDLPDGGTKVSYTADVQVGGLIAGNLLRWQYMMLLILEHTEEAKRKLFIPPFFGNL